MNNSRGKEGLCRRHGANVAKTKTKKCSAEGCTNNCRKEGLCRRHGANLTGPDDEEDKKLEQIVENAIIGKVGETFSAEVSHLHFFILLIF